jgi:glycosyltransferase involved in cell wall biosynthesis
MTIQINSYTAVLITYNAEITVIDALSAIFLQNPPPSEVIVVDDNSSDKTVDLIHQFDSTNKILRLILNGANKGQSSNRNIAVMNARYPVIIFFDDDDISVPNRASLHLEMISNGADLSYVSSKKIYGMNYEVRNINSSVTNVRIDTAAACNYIFLGDKIRDGFSFSIPACTLGIKKSVFSEIGGFDVTMRRLEDVDLFLRATEFNRSFSWSSSIGVLRRHTVGDDKGGALDSKFEIYLLERYRGYMLKKFYRDAKFLAELRRIYFSRTFRELPLFLFRNPRGLYIGVRRVKSLRRRLMHDLKKGKR